jgi:Flp pilus assembly protein TadD
VHNELGIALAKQGHMDDAIAQFREALRLNPDFGNAQANLSQAEAYLRRAPRAK